MSDVKVNIFAPTKPHEKQSEVLNDSSRFKILRAGRKWRKTSLLVSWQMENAILCQKGLTYPLILPFQEQARESVWNDHVARLLAEFDKKGFPYKKNETSMSITFPQNRARFKLFGINNEKALRSNSNWGALGCDEFDDFPSTAWDNTLRPNLMTHKAPAMISGTPKGKRNIWRLSQTPGFKEFHYSSYDNPELDREELDNLVSEAKAKGEDYYLQEIMAEYIKPFGVVYKEWDEKTQFIPLEYDPNLPLHITFDFGVNDPTAIIWIQPNKFETRVIDYYEASDANIEHFISYIHSKPYKPADLYTGDPAGKARTLTTGTSVIDILANKGIYVRTKDRVKIPDQIRFAHTRMGSLYVSNKLERFRDCLLNYRYPEIKSTIRNQENELPIHDEFSHAMRAFEYWAVNFADLYPSQTIKPTIAHNTGAELINLIENHRKYRDSTSIWR